MKSFKYLSMIVAMASMTIVACDPLKDEVNEIQAGLNVVKDIEYTLSDDDYDLIDEECQCARFGNFSSEDDAKAYIPLALTENFPALGSTSSALVTYDLYRGNYVNYDELNSGDYSDIDENITAAFFNDAFPASEDNLASASASLNQNPQDGQVQVIKYAVADTDYSAVDGFDLYDENFNTLEDLSDFEMISYSGDEQVFELGSSSSGYQYVGISGFDNGESNVNRDWLILPKIDLTDNDQAIIKVDHVINFKSDAVIGTDIAIKASIDYNGEGDPEAFTWTNIDFDQMPSGFSYDIVKSTGSLSAYAGENIYIAFFYNSTEDYAPLWRISDIDIKTTEWEYETAVYRYSLSGNEWYEIEEGDDYEKVNANEFAEMGIRKGYFESSTLGQGYIPILLMRNYPYSFIGDSKVVIYDYYTSSRGEIQTRGNIYYYVENDGVKEWVPYSATVEQQLQFGNVDGNWIPDNTIKYTLSSKDYDDIANNEDLGTADGRSNLASFGNFNTNNWSGDDIIDAIDFVLKTNFPSSEVGQKYLVTYEFYNGSTNTGSYLLILDDSGRYVEFTN